MIDLFGLPYDDNAVSTLLERHPAHRLEKPSDGQQYLVCRDGGFDLLFEDATNRGAGKRQNRVLSAVFLYNEGVDKHRRYTGELPFGFDFSDRRDGLRRKRKPDKTWVIGEGRVELDHPEPDHDHWDMLPLTVSAHYGQDGEEIRYLLISPPSTQPDWVAPDTWQKLALLPDRKIDAIKLYCDEHAVGMAEAKLAVERYAAAQSAKV